MFGLQDTNLLRTAGSSLHLNQLKKSVAGGAHPESAGGGGSEQWDWCFTSSDDVGSVVLSAVAHEVNDCFLFCVTELHLWT